MDQNEVEQFGSFYDIQDVERCHKVAIAHGYAKTSSFAIKRREDQNAKAVA